MDGNSPTTFRDDRHPSVSYEEILERDSRTIPDHLRQHPRWDAGTDSVPTARFFDPEYFAKEVKHLWPKIWQWACREEDIPNVGDYHIYEIVGKSLIVVRTAPDTIKAFYNSCLHRARKLVTLNGSKQEFRCPFHGFTWKCDGTFKENPIGWDFPQWKDKDMSLPEAKVETWGGFVFINFDLNAKPLMDYIGPMAEHFEPYNYANRYVAVHVHKIVKANWKITAEAFMESHHSITTHPQILTSLADANSQYDMLSDYVTRQFSAGGVPSPFLDPPPTEEEIIAWMTGRGTRGGRRAIPEGAEAPEALPDGMTARKYMAELTRSAYQHEQRQTHEDRVHLLLPAISVEIIVDGHAVDALRPVCGSVFGVLDGPLDHAHRLLMLVCRERHCSCP